MCEITQGSGSGPCNQANAQTGYLTNYTYNTLGKLTGVSQNAQSGNPQPRSYAYDMLGRITSEGNPETGSTLYVYDSDAGGPCASATYPAGNLVKRTDAMGNVTCYSYDQLHRVTSVTYPSGPYAANTPQKRFVYDSVSSPPAGVTVTYIASRLAEAYTCSGSCTAKITDLFFGYDKNGKLTDVYESTPHSGGYYHVNAAYWPNGVVQSLSAPGLPTFNIPAAALDGEGRPTAVNASSGTNPVTSVTYNNGSQTTQPLGVLTNVTLGSADSDSFSYDLNTGRMKSYSFNVNSKSVIGSLTWNANGSLGSLQITDPLVSANKQICSYSYDDLGRVASANCGPTSPDGSIWTQAFSFDPFGNISKSGTSSYLPNYVLPNGSINNQVQSVGSVAVTSDLDGNLTSDTFHQYTWDAEGRMLTVDGTVAVLTYDAFGRMIEQKVAASSKEILYSPTGAKLALMSGQNLSKAFVGLPGGATAVYASSGLSYYRHADWLGSERFESTPARAKRFDVAYAPYGEDYIDSGTKELNFTGQNQDTVAGLYDFVYREYHPVAGRWISPDPAGLGAVNVMNPQSWNRYAYVANNPLAAVDSLGLQPACRMGSGGEWICRFCHSDGIQSSCGGNAALGLTDLEQQLGGAGAEAAWLGSGSIPWYSVQGGELYSTFSIKGTPYWTSPDDAYHFPSTRVLVDMGPVGGSNMNMNTHRESWLAWILCSLGSLVIFAGFWFYFVFHRLLGLAVHRLVRPFAVLAILVLCFAAAAKLSREKLINCGRIAPLAIALWSLFLSACLWFVYYAREFGYLNSSAALVCYIGSPIFIGLLALLTYPFMRWFARDCMPRGSGGTNKSGIRE